jgi:hypothetical protein
MVCEARPDPASPDVQMKMGAKDALVGINHLSCGLSGKL